MIFWLEVKWELSVDSFRRSEILMQIPAKGIDFKKDEGFALRFGVLRKGSGYFIKLFSVSRNEILSSLTEIPDCHLVIFFPQMGTLLVIISRDHGHSSLGTAQFCSCAHQASPFLNYFQQYY